jgi:hypothetical protein
MQITRYKRKSFIEVLHSIWLGGLLWLGCSTNSFSTEGIVLHKENGKDGYTAIIYAKDGRRYSAVISKSRIPPEKGYQEVSLGDFVMVSGDTMRIGNVVSILVREMSR